jgi:UDPglucose 6-dehydrogenase
MREAASRVIVAALIEAGARIRAYDPVAMEEARRLMPASDLLCYCKDAYEAAKGADALVIATEWQEFRSPDFERLLELLKRPRIFDGRNLYDPAMVTRYGFEYFGIGRGLTSIVN